jgi:hypothetical protein
MFSAEFDSAPKAVKKDQATVIDRRANPHGFARPSRSALAGSIHGAREIIEQSASLAHLLRCTIMSIKPCSWKTRQSEIVRAVLVRGFPITR